MHIKKNDEVKVITGKDKGKTGKVLKALPKENKVVIAGINVRKVHERAKRQGQKGQIVDKSFPIDASNVRSVKTEKSK